MNILITGGAGFIGSNFVKHWLNKYTNDNVVVYDKLTYAGNISNLDSCKDNTRFTFVHGDICDYYNLERAVLDNHIDTIVHFAAETHVDRSIVDPTIFVKTNIEGTNQILEVVRKHNHIRLHHISTDEVFGTLPKDKPEIKFHENTPYNPKSPYSASKAGSDFLVRSYVNTFNIKATISNCSNNYGPYCFPEKLIPLTITRALADQEIPVYKDGGQIRDWIHVFDHCYGIELILKNGKLGETYMLGGHGENTNLTIVNKILELLDKPKSLIVHVGDRAGHDERYAVDDSKIRSELGYDTQKSISEWLKDTVNWYVTNEQWWKPLKHHADKIAEKYLANRLSS
jgi:dTDP-glucose 4,6-dehydratase